MRDSCANILDAVSYSTYRVIHEGAHPMLNVIDRKLARRYWWQLIIRGIIAIIFGILAFAWPGITLAILIIFFGAWVLVDGIFSVAAAVEERQTYGRWWVLLLWGIVGIVIGILTFILPGATALVLFTLIAIWAIVTGIIEISAAIWLSRAIKGEWLLALAGVISIIFGAIMFIEPRAFALAVVYLIAAYAIIFGILLLLRSIVVRSLFA